MSERVAVIAAHPDDEVLGCGGTISRMSQEGRSVHVLLLADGESARLQDQEDISGTRLVAARNKAAEQACEIMGCASLEQLGLPDNRLDSLTLLDVVQRIEAFISAHRPTLLFTHHSGDVNIDHRVVHNAVIAACRPQPGHIVHELLFFEVPSSTEWRPPGTAHLFQPNWFIDVSQTLDVKLRALQAYKKELRPFPHPRSPEAVEALARWRGATVGVPAAEAFMLGRKLL